AVPPRRQLSPQGEEPAAAAGLRRRRAGGRAVGGAGGGVPGQLARRPARPHLGRVARGGEDDGATLLYGAALPGRSPRGIVAGDGGGPQPAAGAGGDAGGSPADAAPGPREVRRP